MKTLADSCVWSFMLRRKDKSVVSGDEQQAVMSLQDAIQDGRVAIIGPIRQEVLTGIKEPVQFEKLRRKLGAFSDEPIPSGDYEEAARLFSLCRSHGAECGRVDMLLCAVVARKHWSILTTDGGLKRCMEILRTEGLLL
jgi:predicted nucleic acid-binding protein